MEGESGPDLELEFPSKPEYIRTARHAAAALAMAEAFPEHLVDDLKLVVSEACTEAVAANAAAEEPASVRLVISTEGGKLTAEVLDLAPPAGPSAEGIADRWGAARFDVEEESFDTDLSLPLIRGLVDELDVTPLEHGGTRLRMVISPEQRPG